MKISVVFALVALLSALALSEETPFTGKKAVVVGGTGTLGFAIARALALSGAQVTLVSRNVHRYRMKGEEAAANITNDPDVAAAGGNATFIKADARDKKEIAAVFKKVGKDLDIVINAAGSLGFLGNLSDCDRFLGDQDHNPIFCYLDPTVKSMMAAAEHMVNSSHPGVIVNIGAYSENVEPGFSKYCPFFGAAARGVEAATYATAANYVLKNVRANAVVLGALNTPFLRNMAKYFAPGNSSTQPWIGEDLSETDPLWLKYKDTIIATPIPSGEFVTVEDVVDSVLFLADPETTYISGTILRVDGGYWASGSAF